MAQTAVASRTDQSATNDIIQETATNPIVVLTDEAKFEQFYQRMKEETDGLQADVSTKRGRDAIAAMAYKVSQTKTAIDKAGLALTEDWRKQTSTVNAARKKITTKLDDLRDQIRAPLNAWEEAEKQRVATCEATIARLSRDGIVQLADTSEQIRARIAAATAIVIDEAIYQEFTEQALAVREATLANLEIAVGRLEKEEADRAELQQLREAQIRRIAAEAERAREEDARAAEQRRSEEIERERQATAQRAEEQRQREIEEASRRERERIEQEARDREAAAERERQAERDRVERERAAERAESEARIAKAEREAQAEREAAAAREQARRDEEQRIAAEQRQAAEAQAARERDIAHRSAVNGEAQAAIMALGVKDQVARNIVLAIAAGTVPHVRIAY